MSVPPHSFFASLERSPPKEVIDFWWLTIEKLAAKDGQIGATLHVERRQEGGTAVSLHLSAVPGFPTAAGAVA